MFEMMLKMLDLLDSQRSLLYGQKSHRSSRPPASSSDRAHHLPKHPFRGFGDTLGHILSSHGGSVSLTGVVAEARFPKR